MLRLLRFAFSNRAVWRKRPEVVKSKVVQNSILYHFHFHYFFGFGKFCDGRVVVIQASVNKPVHNPDNTPRDSLRNTHRPICNLVGGRIHSILDRQPKNLKSESKPKLLRIRFSTTLVFRIFRIPGTWNAAGILLLKGSDSRGRSLMFERTGDSLYPSSVRTHGGRE